MITDERLEEDGRTLKRIQYLQTTVDWSKLTEEQKVAVEEELRVLNHRYYVENTVVREYWKAY